MRSVAFIFMFLMIQAIALSQPCLPEGISFHVQSQIDSFQIKYPNCTEVQGSVLVQGPAITNLDSLVILQSVEGNLVIKGNWILSNLSGLDSITSIGGKLQIISNDAISNIDGLSGLKNIGGGLWICDNNILNNIMALSNLDSIEGPLILGYWSSGGGNPSLSTFAGLHNITHIAGHLHIEDNDAIVNLSGLESVTYVGGSLQIEDNDLLIDINNLDNLNSIGGGLRITDSPSLLNLQGLDGVTSIGGDFQIYNNSSLISLNGLENLTSIGGFVRIGGPWISGSSNPLLVSIESLSNLNTIGGFLEISNNDTLTSLSGLDNIVPNSISELNIYNNNSLSNCEVQSICEYLVVPYGEIDIQDNNKGCNNESEVEEACESMNIQGPYLIQDCSISPNPFTTTTTLSYTLDKPKDVHFTIYNVQSQIVFTMQEKQDKGEQQVQWNAEGLPAGMYYFSITDNSGRIGSGKLLKY